MGWLARKPQGRFSGAAKPPFHPHAELETERRPGVDVGHKNTTSILLADDEEYMRQLAGMTLQHAGFEVVLASNGTEALARLQEATPDLIVSDVMMPEMDGLSLLRRLRAEAAMRSIPVILVTALATAEHVVAGLELGADDYLVKPFHPAELVARVRAKINRPRAGDPVIQSATCGGREGKLPATGRLHPPQVPSRQGDQE